MRHKILTWFLAFSKRLLLKRFFVILLCIFPLFSIMIRVYSHSDEPLIQVALWNEGDTSLATETIQTLTSQPNTIHFYEVHSKEQLYQDVQNTKAECGYIFTDDYKIDNILNEKDWRQTVTVVESPNSMLTGSINELIFASFFRFYSEELVVDYLQQPGVLEPGQDVNQIVKEASEHFKKVYEQ